MVKFFRHGLALQVLLGLVFAFPYFGHAASVSDQISLNTDDADQDGIGSTTQLFSSPHVLGQDRHNGYRFTGHGLPNNAFVLNATIQFTTESGNSSGSPSHRIVGEDADNAVTFVEQTNDISNRTTTSASVIWNIPGWPTVGESGPLQLTPNLSTVVQEIVDRPGWTSGNPLVFIFEPNGGNDTRNAWSFDGSPGDSAALSIEYTLCPGGVVTTTADAGRGSLRECINYVNDGYGGTISFNIPGPGNRSSGGDSWWGIAVLSPLPALANTVVIDGTTQTTNQGDTNSRGPEIEIDGAGAGAVADGIVIGAPANNSTIRGLVIGNFIDNGILLIGDSNTIAGNYIGLSADGDTVAANNSDDTTYQGGIRVESSGNTIGGVTAADRNVLSGNGFAGIELFSASATGNLIRGNYIGTDATGTLDRGNEQEGIDLELASANIIGGSGVGERNILSGNDSDGLEIDGGDFNIVRGNYIGTDVTGTIVIANGRDGIDINENGGDGAMGNIIGGTDPDEGNLIRGNDIYGIQVRGAPASDNSFLGNRIYGNVALDIDLNNDGITVNDPLDADTGSNDLLNYPVITSATETGGTLTVNFDLDVPAGNYRIEFFTNSSGAHPTGNGGGQVFADATTIVHGGAGVQSFVHAFAGSAGDIIAATTTEESFGPIFSSTSEFSTAVTATLGAPFSSSRWPLDETSGLIAADINAGNSGTYRNGVLLNQTAACPNTSNAVHFDGIDDHVEVPHIPGYLLDEGTVAMWVNIDAIGLEQMFFSKDHLGFGTGGHLTVSVQPGGEIQTRLQSTTASMYTTSAPVVAGTWIHIAFSWGSGGMAMYIDGAAPITDPYVGGLGVTSGGAGNFEPIAFGASTVVSGVGVVTPLEDYFAGYMDDVRFYDRALTLPEIQSLAACGSGTVSISGTVFEDVNYGGGAGRDRATANADSGPFALERGGVTVELYDSAGNYSSNTTTAADGSYSFAAIIPALYTVRVVNSTVTSTRTGSDGTELAIQTFRADGNGEAAGEGANKVGGEQPVDEDAPANSGTDTLAVLQAPAGQFTQSIVTIDASGGDVSNVDFGFNFSTIVNSENADQGTLRQFILNANLLTDNASLTQNGLTAGAETSVFMIPGAGDALGRPVDPRQNFGGNSGGEFTIQPVSALTTVTDTVILDATTQTGFAGLPLIELDGTLSGSGDEGFLTAGSGHTIRGFVINRFNDDGIQLGGSGGNTIVGNYIGTDVTGTAALPNGDDGVDVDSGDNVIGGTLPTDRNLISGNATRGMELSAGAADNTLIQGNYIGTDVTGLLPLPNTLQGIRVETGITGNMIGGTAPGAGNIIAHNGQNGILVGSGGSNGNGWLGNAIHSNTLLGIDLNEDGVTPNDPGDPDVGPNDLLNYPVITSALASSGSVTAYFDLDVPAADYRVEFFTNPSGADPSGNGEGELFASAVTITHTGSGSESFSHSFPGAVGDIITSTATEESAGPVYGASSEFSAAVTAVDLCPGGTVTSTADSGAAGTLRSCIMWANGNPGADTLTVPAGTYTLSIVGTGEDAAATGDLDITDDIVINGDAVSSTIVDANAIDRVFHILGASATFSNLTIRNGNTTDSGAGISLDATASLTMSGATVRGNTTTADGGGIDTDGGTVDLTNVTISGNTANRGGGMNCAGPCTLTNVTVTGNTAPTNGGGLRQRDGGGTITFLNTIVANNVSGGAVDCDGNPSNLFSNGYNISSDASCDFTSVGDQQNTDPLLGPLQDNGGPTFTHELLVGSPAIEGGTNAGCPATDQRGTARPAGTNCDIGSFEVALAATSAVAEIAPNDVTTSSVGNAFSYDIAVTIGAGDSGVDRVAITVPGSFGAPTVTDVQVGGLPVAYTDNTLGNSISVDLTTRLTTSDQITVLFNADAPNLQDLIGVDFLSSVDDSGTADPPQATTEGNGDGDGGDLDSWTVTTTDPPGGFCPTPDGAASTGTTVGGTSMTISHTTSGTDRLMLVGVSIGIGTAETVSGITYNSDPLSFEGAINGPGNDSRIEIWSLVAPDTGTHDVVVTLSAGTHDGATAGVMTFAQVHQTNPLGAFSSNSGNSNNASTTVTSAAGELVFGVVSVDDTADYDLIPGAGQTPDRWDLFADSANGGGSTEAGAPSVVTSWSWAAASDDWAVGGISIKPALSCSGLPVDLVKRAFWPDGTPIPTGATIPSGVEFKYLLYINNTTIAHNDLTVRDVLDPAFQYQAGTIQVDNSVGECAAAVCTPVEEAAIFAAVNAAPFLTDAADGDVASYTGASTSIDAGDGNVANLQLDINASAVWAILFSAKMP